MSASAYILVASILGRSSERHSGTMADDLSMILALAWRTMTSASPGPGLVVDLATLQPWQWFIAIITVLGLSPAPWLLGLARGGIQFTAQAEKRHARELAARDEYHKGLLAAAEQRYADLNATLAKTDEGATLLREQNEKLTDALVDSTEVLRVTNHALIEFNDIARQAAQ